MSGYPPSTRAFLSALVLGLAFWGSHSAVVRRGCASGTAIVVMIYVCSVAGLFIAGFLSVRNWAPLQGFAVGGALGIAAGILVGAWAVQHSWLYWSLVLLVAIVIVWLPPLT